MSFLTQFIPGTFLQKHRTNQVIYGNITLAELIAGKTLLVGKSGRTIRIKNFLFKMNGSFTTLTDMRLSTTEASPTLLLTIVQAQMGDAVIHALTLGTHTVAAAVYADLALGTGLQVTQTGTTAAGGTSIDFQIEFTYRT